MFFKAIGNAITAKDYPGVAQAALDLGATAAQAGSVGLSVVTHGSASALEYAAYLPFAVDGNIVNSLQGLQFVQAIAGLGIIVGALTSVVSSIMIYRDTAIIDAIPSDDDLMDNTNDNAKLKASLDKLENVNQNHLLKTLPEHLKTRVQKFGQNINPITYLKDEVEQGYVHTARSVLTEVKDRVTKSRIVHILALVGGVLATVAGIGIFLAFPPALLTALMIVGIGLAVASFVMTKGWAENPKDGFNWKLVLPEFLHEKLKVNKEFETEMNVGAMETGQMFNELKYFDVLTQDEHTDTVARELFNPDNGAVTELTLKEDSAGVDAAFEKRMKKNYVGLKLEETTNARTGIATLPSFIKAKVDPLKAKVDPLEDEGDIYFDALDHEVTGVTHEDVAAFTRPLEPEKKPTFMEKLKGLFTSKTDTNPDLTANGSIIDLRGLPFASKPDSKPSSE